MLSVQEYLAAYHKYDDCQNDIIAYNRELLKEYPFLTPVNVWTGKIADDYDYTYTKMDEMPQGWRIAFGDDLLKDLKAELVKAKGLDEYYITQIKEKYGGLRWYDCGGTEEWYKVILPRYEYLSYRTCIHCGEPAEVITTGWITPLCIDCYNRDHKNEHYKTVKEWFKPL